MPTKTERILSYLPRTFRALPRPTALYSVADAFGLPLLLAENSLAAVMQAHWVDHADRGAEVINDLARMAALYGLAPRPDESVEEFREHLKRYVRTFLEGTVTVQGILRVTAEALGLRIADAYEDMDTWWTRDDDELVTVEPRADDAAKLVLGVTAATAVGSPALHARVVGTPDLSDGGVDLPPNAALEIGIDATEPESVFLTGSEPTRVTLSDIVGAINDAFEPDIASASDDEAHLILTSPTPGPDSRLEVQDVENDAAERVLGLVPRTYHGSEALAAQVNRDLSGVIDLSEERYLRLLIDGTHLAEVDCAGPDPAHTTLNQVRDAINSAFSALGLEVDVASHGDGSLTLTSPTTGFQSSIAFQRPAAQDATARLFGPVEPFHLGQDAQPARLTSRRDPSPGADLSERSNIQLRIDGQAPDPIDCAGEDPANTRPAKIVAAINAAFEGLFEDFEGSVASHNGRLVTVTSPTEGPDGEIVIETPPSGDATEIIFGIGRRTFEGAAATTAQIIGEPNLSEGVDVRARHFLKLAVDGGSPAEIDLRSGMADPWAETASLSDLVTAINNALPTEIASEADQHLKLTSPTTGGASSLAIEPLEITRRRRFVTRAMITDEATQAIFGFVRREDSGTPATSARVVGEKDLSRGVDLQEERYLRLAIDGRPAVDIDCAGKRPRATMIDEVVHAINDELEEKLGIVTDVAAHDGRCLVLTSPTVGAGSRIAIEPPRATDALERLLDVEPGTFRGQDATRVNFVGTVDLSDGVDLDANAAIKLRIDGVEPPVEIILGESEPSHKTLTQLVIAINEKLDQELGREPGEQDIASRDGTHLILTSRKTGSESKIVFDIPDGPDATVDTFGITPPRSYRGSDPVPARVVGRPDLSDGGVDLPPNAALEIGIDAAEPEPVFLTGSEPTHAVLGEIVEAINNAFEPDIASASDDEKHLILTSPTPGLAGQITLEPHISGDARESLLGTVKDVTEGVAPTPAIIPGEADLLTPADLSQRRLIRLAVDGGRPVDIDVAGAAPATTFLDEIVEAINAVFRDLATATEDDRLQLTSPTAGEGSHLSLLPLRYLEVIEYPPKPMPKPGTPPWSVKHGGSWSVVNDGAADVFAKAEIAAPKGVVGPTLVNATLGWRVRLFTVLGSGETVRLWRDAKLGLQAKICSPDCESRTVPGSKILVGPLGAQTWVPFQGAWHLSGDGEDPPTLQLNNPLAPSIVVMRARRLGNEIAVIVTESDLNAVTSGPIVADGSPARLVGRVRADKEALVDANEAEIAHLRPGPDVDLATYQDRVVAVTGPLQAGETPLMIVQTIARLFDVTLRFTPDDGEMVEERYPGVTIGVGTAARDSLVWQISTHPSQLVKAEELNKGTVLTLPRGQSKWIYLDCHDSRFNQVNFDEACFAGGLCYDRAVFNVSRFVHVPPELVAAVFASSGLLLDPVTEVLFRWTSHRPGAFVVNLPADLPARFGGRFNEARFGQGEDAPELYEKAVTEPAEDENYLANLIKYGRPDEDPPILPSTLVTAEKVAVVPLGWEAVQMPFRKPQFLTLGADESDFAVGLATFFRDPNIQGDITIPEGTSLSTAKGEATFVTTQTRTLQRGQARIDVPVRADDGSEGQVGIVGAGAISTLAQSITGITRVTNFEATILGAAARLYIAEEGFDGFIELRARAAGTWGNGIAVTAQRSGPAMYDVSIIYEGARFENARKVALGKDLGDPSLDLPSQVQKLLQPGPIGVLQAKAAGVRAEVTRDRNESIC